MNVTRSSFTPSRLNVGAYPVRVRERHRLKQGDFVTASSQLLRWLAPAGKGCASVSFTRIRKGTAQVDGSLLTLEPEQWRVRHYRRAVMRGAGVYQMGLWAFLGSKRQERTALKACENVSTFNKFPEITNDCTNLSLWASKPYERLWLLPRAYSLKERSFSWKSYKVSVWGRRAVTGWGVVRLGASSRLTLLHGFWEPVTAVKKVTAPSFLVPACNIPKVYLGTFGRMTLNRIRFDSPKWRGTATHKKEVKMLAPPAIRGAAHLLSYRRVKKSPTAKGLAQFYGQEVKKAGGPRAWVEKMAGLLDASKNALAIRREIDKRLRAFTVYSRHTLAKILAAFKELRAPVTPALELFLSLARAAYLEACKLGKDKRPRRLPVPRRPLHTYPRPPAAPLAPPAL